MSNEKLVDIAAGLEWETEKAMLDRTKIPQVSRALLEAADYIREHGWCQGVSQTLDGRVCISGALAGVWLSGVLTGTWLVEGSEVWKMLTSRLGTLPSTWNDEPGRTKEEVIEMLEKIAWEQANA